MTPEYSTRKFQLWLFRVGHGELLVRSPRDEVNPRNVDLVFVGVDYIDLPRVLSGVVVSAASPVDVRRAEERLGRTVDRLTVRVLVTEGRRHLVVAAYFNIEENELDLGEVPFD